MTSALAVKTRLMIDIGHTTEFEQFPAEVTVAGRPYYLVRAEDKYRLLSRICPHAGGYIIDAGEFFLCPIHYWRYAKGDGQCIYPPGARMAEIDVSEQEGRLVAHIEPPAPRPVPEAIPA